MKNKSSITFLVLLILFGGESRCQMTEIKVDYHLIKNGESLLYELKIMDGFSTYFAQSPPKINSNEFYIKATTPGKLIFEKIKKDKKLYYSEPIINKRFYIADSLHPMKWKIIKEMKTVLGYPCQTAKTHFRGRDYIAHFTKKIPVDNGPYKFGGLPGLILEVYSLDDEIKFIAKNISFSKITNPPLPSYQDYQNKYITYQDFKSTYLANWRIIIQKLKARSEEHIPGDEDYIKSHEIEIKYPALQLGRGINLNE